MEISIRFRNLSGVDASSLSSSLSNVLQRQQQEGLLANAQVTASSLPSARAGNNELPHGLPMGIAHLMALARSQGGSFSTPSNGSGASSQTTEGGDSLPNVASPSDSTLERVQQLSSSVAGSIFSDLINGAFRQGDPGPPPASEQAIDNLPCCEIPKGGAQVSSMLDPSGPDPRPHSASSSEPSFVA